MYWIVSFQNDSIYLFKKLVSDLLFSWTSFILSAIVYVLARASSVQNPKCLDVSESATLSGSNPSGAFDIAAYREKLLAQSKPYIIECAEADGGGSQVRIMNI